MPNERGLALCLEERLQGDHRVLQGGDQDRGQCVRPATPMIKIDLMNELKVLALRTHAHTRS